MSLFAVVRLTEEGHDWAFVGDYYDDVDEAREAATELAQYSPGTTYEVISIASIATFVADPDLVEVDVEESESDDE
jgi:hypothetical protein